MSIKLCHELIESLPRPESRPIGADRETTIYAVPTLIAKSSTVELWAQTVGAKTRLVVDILDPSLLSFLRWMAYKGVGYSEDEDGVRYIFTKSKFRGGYPVCEVACVADYVDRTVWLRGHGAFASCIGGADILEIGG